MIEPLRLTVEVDCPTDHAFVVWTEQISSWWPSGHSVSGDPAISVVLEGRVGGRIFERTPAGGEHDWGQVTEWDPPRRLGYLWHIRRDRAQATDVAIAFVDNARTSVEIEHRGWERLGDEGPRWRDANRSGWSGLLPHFTVACANASGAGAG